MMKRFNMLRYCVATARRLACVSVPLDGSSNLEHPMNNNFKCHASSQSLSSPQAGVWLVRTRMCLGFVIALAYCVLFLAAAGAQLYTGSRSGTISDSSGAFIAGTQVQATDDAKGFSFTATRH